MSVATIRLNITSALTVAQQAVCADTEGDRVAALTLYEEASRQLEEIIPFVPSEHAEVMVRYSGIYAKRVAELRDELALTARPPGALRIPQFTSNFIPQEPCTVLPPELPILLRRPFWLMQLLSHSVQKGAMLTPDVYVPRLVWTQDGAHLAVRGVVAKTRYCEQMVDLLAGATGQELLSVEVGVLCHRLDELTEGAEDVWKQLQKALPRADVDHSTEQVEKSRVGQAQRAWMALRSRMTDASENKRTEPSVAYNSYLPWLVSVLESLQALDPLVAQSHPAPVLQRLHKLASHLYLCLCSFVLKDMFTLLYRHMRKLRESFSRLFPKSFLETNKTVG